MPRVIMTDNVDSHIKRGEDILGMYGFSLIPIILGIIFLFAGSVLGFFGFIFVGIIGI